MKKKTPKQLRELFRQWFYKVPGSRYNRFCVHCYHRGRQGECETFCDWFGTECIDAVRKYCPIPTAMVSMLMEIDAAAGMPNQGNTRGEKGGTVVPPSDFQSVSTKGVETQIDRVESLRPHGSARAHLREDTPSATPEICPEIEEFWREFNHWLNDDE